MYYKTLKIILHNVTIIIIIIFTLRSNFFQNPFHLAPYVNFASKLFCFLSRRPPTTIILNIILLFKNKAILSISFNFFSQNNIYRFVYDGAKCVFLIPRKVAKVCSITSQAYFMRRLLWKKKKIYTQKPANTQLHKTHTHTYYTNHKYQYEKRKENNNNKSKFFG